MKTFTAIYLLLGTELAAASLIPAEHIEVFRRGTRADAASDSAAIEEVGFTPLTTRDLAAVADVEYMNSMMQPDEAMKNCPYLQCGCKRWGLCLLSAGGALASCGWALNAKGADYKEDTKCAGAISSFGSNLPKNCRLCMGL